MTKLIKLLVSVLGDVTSACIKLLSIGMTSILHIRRVAWSFFQVRTSIYDLET